MQKFGNSGKRSKLPCENWYVPQDEHISKIEWTYGKNGVSSIIITTNTGAILSAGMKRPNDEDVYYEFDDNKPFVGFHGYEDELSLSLGESVLAIQALGVIKSVCALKRPPVQEPIEPPKLPDKIVEKVVYIMAEDPEGQMVSIVSGTLIVFIIGVCIACVCRAQRRKARKKKQTKAGEDKEIVPQLDL